MKTLKRSMPRDSRQMEFPWMCSAEDSPAKISAPPGEAPDCLASEAVCGGSSTASSKKSARNTRSSKTSAPFDLADWTKCSGRSLRSGMMRNGIVYPLPPLAPPTGGIASGLLPIPTVRDHFPPHSPEYIAAKRAQGHGMANLNDFVAHPNKGLWPTPSASPAGEGQFLSHLTNKNGGPPKQGERVYNPNTGKHVQITLNRAVRMWPTPHGMGPDGHGSELSQAVRVSLGLSDSERSARKVPQNYAIPQARHPTALVEDPQRMWRTPKATEGMGRYSQVNGKRYPGLWDQVKMWPTPTSSLGTHAGLVTSSKAREGGTLVEAIAARTEWPTPTARAWKDNGESPAELARNSPTLAVAAGGQLNPTWVEWLMGFPLEWTVCEHSATRSSRKSRKSSGARS